LDKAWQDTVKAVNIPLERAVLALSSLGVSKAILKEIYALNDESLEKAIQKGLREGKDSRLKKLSPEENNIPDYDEAPFGKAHLADLLEQPEVPFDREELEFKWKPLKVPLYRVGEFGFEEVDATRSKLRLDVNENITQFCDRLKGIFLAPSKLELLILLPCSGKAPTPHWDILSSQYEICDRNSALRLLSCLTVLGLPHRNSGHRTEYLPNLVTRCKGLFEQVAACNPNKLNTINPPNDPTLKEQIGLFNKNVLILKPKTSPTENVEPFALNFPAAWKNNDHKYTEWLIRDRAQDADEMVRALILLMPQTSGIFCQISLEPRLYIKNTFLACKNRQDRPCSKRQDQSCSYRQDRLCSYKPEIQRNVQIIGPNPWISFLSKGHGHSRKSETFAPYILKDDATVPLLCVDEPLPHKVLKERKKAQ
jgi:hypothetical protein